jgi:CRP/FNR family nitrogen fixation transcriptional regulator
MLTESPAADLCEIGDQPFLYRPRPAHPHAAQGGVPMSFARNAEIYAEGEAAGHVYKVVSGVVRISRLLPDGRRHISAFHLPGDVFGFEADDMHCTSAEAIVPTKLIALKWRSLGDTGSASLIRELLAVAMRGLKHTQEHLLLLGRKNALERLSAFLVEMAERSGSPRLLELAMPRHDIADYLGLTLETVSRTFAELKELGAIELESARRVRVLDQAGLKAMAA